MALLAPIPPCGFISLAWRLFSEGVWIPMSNLSNIENSHPVPLLNLLSLSCYFLSQILSSPFLHHLPMTFSPIQTCQFFALWIPHRLTSLPAATPGISSQRDEQSILATSYTTSTWTAATKAIMRTSLSAARCWLRKECRRRRLKTVRTHMMLLLKFRL